MDEISLTVEDARTALRQAQVTCVQDRVIESHGRSLPLRLYTPPGKGPFPVLVFFHGGGWVTGDLDTHDGFCRLMCEWAGCAVVAVDYARPPEHLFPAALEDCWTAFKWVTRQGAGSGLDTSAMAVAGGGSGGGMAAVISQRDAECDRPRICFQLLLYPLLDCHTRRRSHTKFAQGHGLTTDMLEWYLVHYLPPGISRTDTRLSPLLSLSLHGLPRTLIITCGHDVLRDEGRAYATRLRAAGVIVEHKEFSKMRHGFMNYPAAHEEARRALLLCARTLQAQFRSE
ncbi:alpha/beta hydrolase [Pseudomonas fitomaticsae]|uniref:Alpha/beta hydrolase n=1 Tax=Pseudomonas fitomaticsae TaxID=2837969 RepID=A0ABY3PV14_9PSED|nr:alpha/beta hydrolase [Pseudomonas fitomaticsae]UFP97498.1 alpha/beta hydrolase [Pseudomonas fitomaticsae]